MQNFCKRTTKALIVDAQADLSLRWVHISEGMFSLVINGIENVHV